jgi:hypothetical protein
MGSHDGVVSGCSAESRQGDSKNDPKIVSLHPPQVLLSLSSTSLTTRCQVVVVCRLARPYLIPTLRVKYLRSKLTKPQIPVS